MTTTPTQETVDALMASTVTVSEAADILGVTTRTVIRYIDAGHLDRIHLGPRAIRVRRAGIDTLLAKKTER